MRRAKKKENVAIVVLINTPSPASELLLPKYKIKFHPLTAALLSFFLLFSFQCSRKESEEIHHQLTTLAPSDALDALDKLESALRTSNVRNMAAYLSGVVRRITQLSPSGHDGAAALPPLFPEAQSVLDYLYHAGTVRRGDIDSKQLMTLSKKSPEYQVLVMDTFRDRNLRGIRNMAGKEIYSIRNVSIGLFSGFKSHMCAPPWGLGDTRKIGRPLLG